MSTLIGKPAPGTEEEQGGIGNIDSSLGGERKPMPDGVSQYPKNEPKT